MIRGIEYSKPLAAACATAIIASCTMAWLRVGLNAKISEQRRRASTLESNLTGQMEAKSEYDDENLNALRERVGRLRTQLGPDGTWERVAGQFGDGWKSEPGPSDDKNGYSVRYGTFKLLSPAVTDWAKIVEAVRNSEAIPGVAIAEFEMKTSGGRDRRSLDLVRILVAVRTSRSAPYPAIAQ